MSATSYTSSPVWICYSFDLAALRLPSTRADAGLDAVTVNASPALAAPSGGVAVAVLAAAAAAIMRADEALRQEGRLLRGRLLPQDRDGRSMPPTVPPVRLCC